MRAFKIMLALGAAIALVGACQKPAKDGAKSAGEASASASAGAPAGAVGLSSEGPRPGKWRVTTAMEGMPEGVAMPAVETCITATTFEEMQRQQSGAQPGVEGGMTCSEQSFRRDGNAMVGHSVCTHEGGMRTVTDTRVTGDLSSRYVMEVRTQTTPPPPPGMGDNRMTMTAERLGDC